MTFQPTGMASLLFWGARPSCLQLSHACQEIAPNLSSDRAPAKTRKQSNKYTNTTKICVCVCIHYIYIWKGGHFSTRQGCYSVSKFCAFILQRAMVLSFCSPGFWGSWFLGLLVSGLLGFWVSWFLGFLVSRSLGFCFFCFWVSWFIGFSLSCFWSFLFGF